MRFLTMLLLMVICSVQIQATTIRVPADFPTIQAGINSASESDTVLVASGTYTGFGNRDLNFNGVNLVLKSESGADVTIIDCQGTNEDRHIGIKLDNNEDSTSLIEGFTFINAFALDSGLGNGAITFWTGVANIKDCIFTINTHFGIELNYGANSCSIVNCSFLDNQVGLENERDGTVIKNCQFTGNGNGMVYKTMTYIYNSIFTNNGHGITNQYDGLFPILIDHCTFVSNFHGVELSMHLPKSIDELNVLDTIIISNSLIAYNNGFGISVAFDWLGQYKCENTNVFGNTAGNWQFDYFSHSDSFGNLSVNPLFCDTTVGDYYLGDNSPCAAVNNSSGSSIGVYDIGCTCCRGIRGNVDGDYDEQVDISDLVFMVDCIFSGCYGVCEEEVDMDASGNYDISDLVYLVDFIFLGGHEPQTCN